MVKGVIFMGTPHRGADGAFWANFTARALESLGNASSTGMLEDLQKNSVTLGQISQQFVERGSTLRMKTFYETIKPDSMNSLVYLLFGQWPSRIGFNSVSSRLWKRIQLS